MRSSRARARFVLRDTSWGELGIAAQVHSRVQLVLRDTSELRGLGMRMGGGRAQLAIHYGDIQRVLVGDRL